MWEKRSETKELIDLGSSYYTADEYQHCLKNLFKINKLLGFFRQTKKMLKSIPRSASVLEVGCGSGLFLLHLSHYFPNMKFDGVDISEDAIQQAQENLKHFKLTQNNLINFKKISEDWHPDNDCYDIVIASLLCHHLNDDMLVQFFKKYLASTTTAVIIYDLHRHPLSYYLYQIISPLFRNRLITHDGLISIQRGFKKNEILSLLKKANVERFKLSWQFPFCWRLILWKK